MNPSSDTLRLIPKLLLINGKLNKNTKPVPYLGEQLYPSKRSIKFIIFSLFLLLRSSLELSNNKDISLILKSFEEWFLFCNIFLG